jgi:LysM repeat protein
VAGFLALAVLAMGVTIAGNYKKMQNMEVSINRLELTSDVNENNNTAATATVIPPEDLEKADSDTSISIKAETEVQTEAEETFTDVNGNDDSQSTGEVLNEYEGENATDAANVEEAATDINVTNVGDKIVYEVKQGDTLTSIALAYYGSVGYVDDIADANSVGEDYVIYEGEKIVLPDVE